MTEEYDPIFQKILDEQIKIKARQQVSDAVRKGKLMRGSCTVCGSYKNIDGHHEDYSKPLDIVWLCKPCHKARHKQLKEEGKSCL